MKTAVVAIRAAFYVTGFLLFFAWLALRVRTFDRSLEVSLPRGTETPGVVLMLIGGILALVCAGAFVTRGRGTPAPFDAPSEFVAVGPYRYSRNPMYIGGLVLLVGFGLYEHSISILLMALVLFAIVHLFVVFYEEPILRKSFGSSYGHYCGQVSRWIPRVRQRE